MADRKKRGFYREYLNDFQRTADGGYVYRGECFRYDGDEARKKRFAAALAVLTALAAAFVAVPECLEPTEMSRSPITIIPWGLSLAAVFAVVWTAVRLLVRLNDLKAYIFEKTVRRLPLFCIIACALSCATTLSQIIYICVFGISGDPVPVIWRAAFSALCAAACFCMFRLIRAARFTSK